MLKKINAFSLIEMLIVIAIISILTVLGVVWYQDAVIKTNRARGISLMQEEAVRRQQLFILSGNYGAEAIPLPGAAYADLRNIFQLSISMPSSSSFVLSLTANDPSSLSARVRDANCFEITLDQTGRQRVVAANGSGAVDLSDLNRACWR